MRLVPAAVLALAAALTVVGTGAARTGDAVPKSYVVVFTQQSGLAADVDRTVAAAGGSVDARLPELGAVSVTSTNPGFAEAIAAAPGVDEVGEDVTRQFVGDGEFGDGPAPADAAAPPTADPLFGRQWDKARMGASPSGSYSVQRGRRDVVVAVLDTGADLTNPDVAGHLDQSLSRSFVPSEPSLQDGNGHGSWVLSAVGAPLDGVGISGVAPDVSLVALKVFDAQGRSDFLSVDNALVYAGEHHFDVAVMSFGTYADRSNQADGAQLKLFERALHFARSNGVLPVAALGNENRDLSDGGSMGSLLEFPGEVSGVVGVSATGYRDLKAFYSNYGSGRADVAAPGGDTMYQPAPSSIGGGGRVLGAWSASAIARVPASYRIRSCGPTGCGWYVWQQGTSMAAPNAAGVAALIISQYGDFRNNPKKPHMSPGAVQQALERSADPQPCPANPFDPGPWAATCQGDPSSTSFYGAGIVNALRAVTQ